ncbi:MAG: T9SS type A sorting domain-containing protein [Bacteroidales bacterium]|nr:T9SS type A sorting domain-containing protein [Bacteroidales bacterium]
MNKKIYIIFFAIFSIVMLQAQTPAFPGAEGGGMYTVGGRGGAVYYVTTLEDTNTEGSLRWAINQTGKRTILFRVSGLIELKSDLRIRNGNLTIAGQTAPGDGITIKNFPVIISADNVIIRYLRFRMGDEAVPLYPTYNWDGGDALWGKERSNIIIDHCSMSWSVDETSSFYDNKNFTMQWCIIAESLRNSVHGKGKHGYGGIWGGQNASFHHNMFFSHDSRTPRFNGSRYSGQPDLETVDYRNNVIYNWGSNNAYGAEGGSYNLVNNYYKPGPASSSSSKKRFLQPYSKSGVYGKFYLSGNVMTTNSTITNNNWNGVVMGNTFPSGTTLNNLKSETEFSAYPVNTHTAEDAFEKVLLYGGASLSRDTLDRRYVKEARLGTVSAIGSNGSTNGLIDTQVDAGGYPTHSTLPAPKDSNNDGIPDGWLETNFPGKISTDVNEQGYTYLEVYLNSLVAQITEGQGYEEPQNQEQKILFCENSPSELPVVIPIELSNLITDGAMSYEDRTSKTDGCHSENKFAWRTSDVTFTLPENAIFSAKFASNGTRYVNVSVDGEQLGDTYKLKNGSCELVYFDLKNSQNIALRIQSFGSDSVSYSSFSLPELCIKQASPTSVSMTNIDKKSQVIISKNEIIADAQSIEIYNISGQLMKHEFNTNSINIDDLNNGIYITRVLLRDGSKETLKFVK